MPAPADRRYLDSHEWHKLDGDVVTLGITDFAVDELTDLTYVALPKVGAQVNAGDSIGEIESVKATSELYTGVSGKVTAVNTAAAEDPAVVNDDPFNSGWLVKIQITDRAQLDKLLDAASYNKKYPLG